MIEFEIACELPDSHVRRDESAQDTPPAVNGFRGGDAIGPSKTTREEFARLMLGAFAATLPVCFRRSPMLPRRRRRRQGRRPRRQRSWPTAARLVVQRESPCR
jgi:hypothetical protein